MKRLFTALTALLTALAVPALLQAQSPATSGGGKIGVINIQQAIAGTAEGRKALEDLQKKYQPRQADLQRQQQEIQNLQDQLQRQAATLSDAEAIRLRRELADKQKLFQRAQEDAQSDFQEDRQDVINRIGQKMVQMIQQYAKENGYSLILDAQIPVVGTNQVADAQIPIYYADKNVDITGDIVKRYDAANPVAGAPAAPSGAAPAAKPAAPKTTPPIKKP